MADREDLSSNNDGITKDTNPKDALGIKKAYLSTVPMPVIFEVGLGLLEGARKGYGRHNYRVTGVMASVYFDATMRHLAAWWEGEDIDPDSKLSHITKAICSLTVLRDAMINEKWSDDRPPRPPEKWMQTLNEKAGEMIERYPNPTPPFTHKALLVQASEALEGSGLPSLPDPCRMCGAISWIGCSKYNCPVRR